MGYDMSIEAPEADAVAEKERFYSVLYGKDGLYDQRNSLAKQELGGTRKEGVDVWAQGLDTYEDGTGSQEWQEVMKEIAEVVPVYKAAEAKTYFRLNIWGMQICRQLMDDRDMLALINQPRWPEFKDFGLDEFPDTEVYNKATEDFDKVEFDAGSPERRYLDAADAVRDGTPDGAEGMPIYKFGSNDGWLVTPAEINDALARYHEWLVGRELTVETDLVTWVDADSNKEQVVEWWPGWITFLREAADHGGFRVY